MLTKSEEEIMEFMWDAGEPLTSSEIVSNSQDKTWKDSYVHLLLNSLMYKEVVRVAGFKRATKNYARSFEPTMTREEYVVRNLTTNHNYDEIKIMKIIKEFTGVLKNPEVLDELEKAIKERKASL